MKVKIDTGRLRIYMRKRGIRTLKQLARECGLNPNNLYQANSRGQFTSETLWLISDRLGCTINDIIYPDWEDGA